jgi:beta-lactamase class A
MAFICGLLALTLLSCAPEEGADRSETNPEPAPPAERPEPAPPPELPPELAGLQRELEAVVEDSECQVGVAVLPLEGEFAGEVVGVNEDLTFPSASLIKVLVLAELLREVDAGERSLEDRVVVVREDAVGGSGTLKDERLPQALSLGQLAGLMISVSDNTATNVLIDELGFERINALAARLELDDTRLGRKMMDVEDLNPRETNLTSAADMVALLAEIYGGDLLSRESREFMLELLRDQRTGYKLPAGLPPDTEVAHKTGELDAIEHDAGIVLLPGRSFAVAVLTEGPREEGVQVIRRVARLSYEALDGRE